MTRKHVMRIASAILGGLAVGLAFLAALLVLNSGGALAGCTAFTAAGWTIPLIAGGLVGGVAWLLLADDEKHYTSASQLVAHCAGCGRAVPNEWRLCPYCGAFDGMDENARFAPSAEESHL